MQKQKQGKKSKRRREHKFTDPCVAARRNVETEIRKALKKMEKLLRLRDENKRRANCSRIIRDEKGAEAEKVSLVRYQGIRRDGERHRRLLQHIEALKKCRRELRDKRTPDMHGRTAPL